MKILVVNGPILNKLGQREPEKYGKFTLQDIEAELKKLKGADFSFFQSAIEGEIVNTIIESDADGIIINAGAYTHYSVAIRDALTAVKIKAIEVLITNTAAREIFRNVSVISEVFSVTITGFGIYSYVLAAISLIKGYTR